jgi:predicted PurR-regulated permease PerM
LSVLQIGPIPVAAPVLLWAWYSVSRPYFLALVVTTAAIIAIDALLKPYVMGRGAAGAMILYTLGIIGGVMTYGMIGVFVGPVVLAVSWDLIKAWLDRD